jgi:hypothetical protein
MAHKIDPIKITEEPWHGIIKVHSDELICPRCHSPEMKDKDTLNIRAFKVNIDGVWHSQCLVCKDAGAPQDGWFCTEINRG